MTAMMEGNWHLVPLEPEKPTSIRGTESFKRTFPLDETHGVLISGACSADEQLLERNKGLYADVKLLRGLWASSSGDKRSATYFPLAAPTSPVEAVLWGSAGRCFPRSNGTRPWRCGYGQRVLPFSPSTQAVHHTDLDLRWLRDSSERNERIPSQPAQRIDMSGADALPDFGFTLTQPEPPPFLEASGPVRTVGMPTQLFIPSARQLTAGDPVCVLGFAARPCDRWARTFLRTEDDYERAVEEAKLRAAFRVGGAPHGAGAAPCREDWRLDSHVATRRALDLVDDVCYPSSLVASPGLVVGASHRIIEHTCSTFPGMTGGPGVDIEAPWQLLFVHTRADQDFSRNSYGYSVHHPLFVKAYEREVLPRLLASSPEMLSPEMLRCLRGYLDANKDQLADPGVLRSVEQRC